jgi:hypothetical protein
MAFGETPVSVNLSPCKMAPREFRTISAGSISGFAEVATPIAFNADVVGDGVAGAVCAIAAADANSKMTKVAAIWLIRIIAVTPGCRLHIEIEWRTQCHTDTGPTSANDLKQTLLRPFGQYPPPKCLSKNITAQQPCKSRASWTPKSTLPNTPSSVRQIRDPSKTASYLRFSIDRRQLTRCLPFGALWREPAGGGTAAEMLEARSVLSKYETQGGHCPTKYLHALVIVQQYLSR